MIRALALTALSLTAALGLAAPAAAQDQGPLRIEITDGVVEPMPIALAPFFGNEEMARDLSLIHI